MRTHADVAKAVDEARAVGSAAFKAALDAQRAASDVALADAQRACGEIGHIFAKYTGFVPIKTSDDFNVCKICGVREPT